MRRGTPLWVVGFVCLEAGCGSEQGALGQASFQGVCESGDFQCLSAGLDAPLAVGAAIDLEVDAQFTGSSAPHVAIESVASDIVAVEGHTATAMSEGVSAILLKTEGDRVLDFVHLWAAEADAIGVIDVSRADESLNGPVQLLVGDDIVLGVRLAAGEQLLLGKASTDWTVDEEDVVTILQTGIEGQRRLVARAEGTVTLTATVLEHEATLTVEVLP